jgi:hypothetical protein
MCEKLNNMIPGLGKRQDIHSDTRKTLSINNWMVDNDCVLKCYFLIYQNNILIFLKYF